MLKRFLEQKERELEERTVSDQRRRRAIQEEIDRARKYQLELKERQEEEKRAEIEKFVAAIKKKDQEALEAEKEAARKRRWVFTLNPCLISHDTPAMFHNSLWAAPFTP